jgi:membrane protein YdbS with pleckstrin-like domain
MPDKRVPTCREFPPEKILIVRRTFQISSVFLSMFWLAVSTYLDMILSYTGLVYTLIIFLGGILFIVILNLLYQWQYYKNYYYDLRISTLLVKSWGVYGKTIEIPYEKIEKVSLYADYLDSFFEIYNVRIERSCTGSGGDYEACLDVYIRGLRRDNAEKLMKTIWSKARRRKNES